MLRYVLYFGAIFLIADHVYTHWGPEIINRLASKFFGRNVTVVEEPPYRESVIDKVIRSVRDKVEDVRR